MRVQTAVCQVMASVLWDSEGIMLVELLKSGAMISSEQYVHMYIREVKMNLKGSAERKMNQVLIAS